MKNTIVSTLVAVAAIIAAFSCKKNESPTTPGRGADKIVVGQTVDAGSTIITGNGGTITVSKPGTPIDGLQIVVPRNALTSAKTFSISYAPIESHTFGADFNPISPLITIENGGGYADSIMTVKIPVHITAGTYAMAFFYDERTQKLEALPLLAEDSTSLTVGTMHFDPDNISGSAYSKGGGNMIQGWRTWAHMVVTSISLSRIYGMTRIASGFNPGIDDWEFINMGSFTGPAGICAGQSISAMWYYYEKRIMGAAGLYKQFDRVHLNPEILWQDNPRGYRLASAVQNDLNCNGWLPELVTQSGKPDLTFQMFALGILITGEPQLLAMASTVDGGGHAMVVYAVSPSDGKLWVADPNYPGDNLQSITYKNGKIGPYVGKLRADAPETPFDLIGCFCKTAWVRWDKIGQRYSEFLSGTVGNAIFPAYNLTATSEGNITLHDTLRTKKDTLRLHIALANPASAKRVGFLFFDNMGTALNVPSGIPLNRGVNTLGIYILAKPNAGDTNWQWTDFKWVTIVRSTYTIESPRADGAPIAIPGYSDTIYAFRCNGQGTFPAHPRFEWDFGDGSGITTRIGDSTTGHYYWKRDTFKISVSVYDNDKAGSAPVGVDTQRVIIIPYQATFHGAHDTTVTTGKYQFSVKAHTDWTVSGGDVSLGGTVAMMRCYVAREKPVHVGIALTAQVTPASYTADSSWLQYDVYTALTPYFGGQDTSWSWSATPFEHTVSVTGTTLTADFTLHTMNDLIWVSAGLILPVRRDRYENGHHTHTDYYTVPVNGGMGYFSFEAP